MGEPVSSVPTEAPSPPSSRRYVTVLSIDGGGVRGLIPAVLLRCLEKELQECAGDPNVRIADYFDVIAGTSTGGLITAMLTAPNDQNRPLFTASRIVQFYKEKSADIFPKGLKRWKGNLWELMPEILRRPRTLTEAGEETASTTEPEIILEAPKPRSLDLMFPSYAPTPLRKILQDELKQTRLENTLTKVVIPTYDMKKTAPTIFSSYKIEEMRALNAKLSDICLGTTAAPTYFPPHYFTNENEEFHLIDGGVNALNPGLAAISEVTQEKAEKPDILPMMTGPNDYKNFLMISLGCGTQRKSNTYDAQKAWWWGALPWVTGPLIEFLQDGTLDMTDYHLVTVFGGAGQPEGHYLRIQDDGLTDETVQMDNSSSQNLTNLEIYAENLLKKRVKRMSTRTFQFEEVPDENATNAAALKSLAAILESERQARLQANPGP